MALSATTNRNDYTGNDAVSAYAYGFRIFANTDLRVTILDTATSPAETTLALTTDYTVDGVGAAAGGNVTLVNSSQSWLTAGGNLKTGYALTIRRVRPLTQTTDIRNQGDFFPETHEDSFDHGIMVDQQQQDEINRTIKLPETEVGTAAKTTLPAAATRASKFLAFNASSEPIASDGSGTPASTAWAAVIDDTTIAAGLKTIRDALTEETALATDDEIFIYDLSETAGNRMTIANALKVINVVTAETSPAVADEVLIYDASATAARKMTLANLFKTITALTAETAPATADELAIYDASAGTADKITLANLLLVINELTADATPDAAADYVVTYDASAAAAKKVLLSNIGLVAATQAQMEAASSNVVAATPGRINYHPGVAKAWVQFSGSGAVTINASHNVSSVTDVGVGLYTVNFTTAFSTANYAFAGMSPTDTSGGVSGEAQVGHHISTARTDAALPLSVTDNGGNRDMNNIGVVCFGDQA